VRRVNRHEQGRIARYQADSIDMEKRIAAFHEVGIERQIDPVRCRSRPTWRRGPGRRCR